LSTPWYELPVDEVMQQLDTGPDGLNEETASARLEEYGPNEIEFEKTPAWVRFLRQFNDPMVIILLVTATITGILTTLGSHRLPHRHDLRHEFPHRLICLYRDKAWQETKRDYRPPFIRNRCRAKNGGGLKLASSGSARGQSDMHPATQLGSGCTRRLPACHYRGLMG